MDYDTEPWEIPLGTTASIAWQVTVPGGAAIASPWQARAQIRATVAAGTTLETLTCTIEDGYVKTGFTSTETAAMTWTSGVLGVEIYDDSTPPVVYRVAQLPVIVSPEVVR